MSAKRIIGHTVGTPISINKLKEEIDVKEAVDAAITEMKENGEIVGTPGADGSRWFSGTQVSIDGGYPVYLVTGAKTGDYYWNTNTGNVYKAGTTYWEYVGNIKGDPYTLTEADKATIVGNVLNALPKYDGEYEVTPIATNDTTLKTAQTYVDADITIKKIPYYEVSNNSGGNTVYIGNEV